MGVLQSFERRLENMISGVFARAFRSAVQPVEISAALQREVDNNAQILSRDRRLVPNDFHVELSHTDLDRLAPYDSAMAKDMSTALQQYAEQQSYASRARSRSTTRRPRTCRPGASASAARRPPA